MAVFVFAVAAAAAAILGDRLRGTANAAELLVVGYPYLILAICPHNDGASLLLKLLLLLLLLRYVQCLCLEEGRINKRTNYTRSNRRPRIVETPIETADQEARRGSVLVNENLYYCTLQVLQLFRSRPLLKQKIGMTANGQSGSR